MILPPFWKGLRNTSPWQFGEVFSFVILKLGLYLIDLGAKGCETMYNVIGKKSEKSYREFHTAWDALQEAVQILENRNHAAQLCWCGVDVEFYKEVTGNEPSAELKEDSFILGDGDFFTVVNRSCTLEDINCALSDVAENIYIEEV